MRSLITGADGQLGSELRPVLAHHSTVFMTWPAFNLLSPACERQILDAQPDVIMHAAAYTDVDKAEQEPELAMAVNAFGTERVARAAATCGARLIYLSTDYVFDGTRHAPYTECDPTNPINAYGRSKLQGERVALTQCPRALVVRTSWLYGAKGKNFVATIMNLASVKPELRVVADQRGCPTYAGDLAKILVQLIDRDVVGILHATGSGDCSWHELACMIVSRMGLSTPVIPITSDEVKRPAPRPSYSVLSNERLAELGFRLPHWTDALGRFIEGARAPAGTQVFHDPAGNGPQGPQP